jgi:hypothetical protein
MGAAQSDASETSCETSSSSAIDENWRRPPAIKVHGCRAGNGGVDVTGKLVERHRTVHENKEGRDSWSLYLNFAYGKQLWITQWGREVEKTFQHVEENGCYCKGANPQLMSGMRAGPTPSPVPKLVRLFSGTLHEKLGLEGDFCYPLNSGS